MTGLGLLKKPVIEKTAWVLFAFSLSLDVFTTLILVHNFGLQAERNIILRQILSWNYYYYLPVACTAYISLYTVSYYFKKKSRSLSVPGWDIVYLTFLSIPLSLAFVEFTIAYHNLYLILGVS
jgi:hypothetical protein